MNGSNGFVIAAYVVKSLELTTVRWLVIVVVLYTAVTLLLSAFSASDEATTERARV